MRRRARKSLPIDVIIYHRQARPLTARILATYRQLRKRRLNHCSILPYFSRIHRLCRCSLSSITTGFSPIPVRAVFSLLNATASANLVARAQPGANIACEHYHVG